MNPILKYSGVVALVILAILGVSKYTNVQHTAFGSASACTDGYTCFTNLETQGNSIIDGTASFVGAITAASASFTSATLSGLLKTDGGILQSNVSATTTSGTAAVLALADFNTYNTIILTPNKVADTTLTFPASSTVATFLPTAGDMQYTCFLNATTSAATIGNYVFAGGTGFNLQVASSSVSALGSVRLLPGKTACFTFVRNGATATTFDLNAAVTLFQ